MHGRHPGSSIASAGILSHEGLPWNPACRDHSGSTSFRDNSCFPMHFGLVQGSPTSRTYGFPLPDRGRGQASRERRVSGGYDGRQTIKTPCRDHSGSCILALMWKSPIAGESFHGEFVESLTVDPSKVQCERKSRGIATIKRPWLRPAGRARLLHAKAALTTFAPLHRWGVGSPGIYSSLIKRSTSPTSRGESTRYSAPVGSRAGPTYTLIPPALWTEEKPGSSPRSSPK